MGWCVYRRLCLSLFRLPFPFLCQVSKEIDRSGFYLVCKITMMFLSLFNVRFPNLLNQSSLNLEKSFSFFFFIALRFNCFFTCSGDGLKFQNYSAFSLYLFNPGQMCQLNTWIANNGVVCSHSGNETNTCISWGADETLISLSQWFLTVKVKQCQ